MTPAAFRNIYRELIDDNPLAVRAVFLRDLPVLLGVALIMTGVKSPMLVAIGMYLPIGTTFAIFVGGLIRWRSAGVAPPDAGGCWPLPSAGWRHRASERGPGRPPHSAAIRGAT